MLELVVLLFAWPYAGVHRSTSPSSSLLLQQCPACLAHLTWIVFVMGGSWPYSWCLVGCCQPGLVQYCLQHPTIFFLFLLLNAYQPLSVIVMIDICTHLTWSVCGAWYAKLLFVRDPRCMLSIKSWFAHGMKSQDVGSANSGSWMEDDCPA